MKKYSLVNEIFPLVGLSARRSISGAAAKARAEMEANAEKDLQEDDEIESCKNDFDSPITGGYDKCIQNQVERNSAAEKRNSAQKDNEEDRKKDSIVDKISDALEDVTSVNLTERRLRSFIRQIIIEDSKLVLGEPDQSAEDERAAGQEEDVDEVNTIAGLGSGLGPSMPLSYDPEKPIYNPYKKAKK